MAGRLATALRGCLLSALGALAAPTPPRTTQEVFARFAERTGQVRIVDTGSQSKVTIGSGFFAAPDLVVTNYHVVSRLVQHPERHRVELVRDGEPPVALTLVNLDVVHDLAVLRTPQHRRGWFALAATPPGKGTRLYALGNPHDLGSSIVEGTYNGLLEGSLYEKIHFTGAINPGMSGGPAITADGRVVGINVATAGNEVSFLVPARFAATLVATTQAPGHRPPARLLGLVRQQLRANQDALVAQLLSEPFAPVALGPYRLPGRLAAFMKCWGDSRPPEPDRPYEHVRHTCSSEDSIYVDDDLRAGAIEVEHHFFRSDVLNRFQLASLRQASFERSSGWLGGQRARTPFRCQTDFVDHRGASWKVVFCLRGHTRLVGLYDVVLKAASIHRNDVGVDTTLELTGVTFDNAARVARHYVESMTWTE